MNLTKKSIIYIVIILILLISNLLTISHCSSMKYSNETNISALTDSIKYFKSKSGTLVAQKTMLNGDLSILKKVNDSLYNIIKNTGVSKPDNVVYSKVYITDDVHDTVWVAKHDTVTGNSKNSYYIYRNFNFSNQYRTLAGSNWYSSDGITDSLGLRIDTNTVKADFTVIQKDNQVYITSNNPYIKYENIIGITNNTKKKKFGIGPIIGVGINQKAKVSPFIGVGLMYNIFNF